MHYALRVLIPALLLLNSVGASASPGAAQELVQQTSERMLSALKSEQSTIKANPARVYALADNIVLPHFDFQRMSSLVLGKYWRTATPEQQAQFTQEFRNLLVRTYATAMTEYSGQQINYLPLKAAPDASDVTVRTEILQPGGPPVGVNYSLYQKDGTWKVYDVIIEDISLVTSYRSSFASQIKRSSLDDLIAQLVARSKNLATADPAP
jgi:phospholipid transport system substrate-binding protein